MDELPRARPVSPDLIRGTTPRAGGAPAAWDRYGPPDPARLHSAPPPAELYPARRRHFWAAVVATAFTASTALAMGAWVAVAVVCVVFIVMFGAPPSVTGPLWFWFTRTGTIGAAIPLAVGLCVTIAASVALALEADRRTGVIVFAWVSVACGMALEGIGIAIVTH